MKEYPVFYEKLNNGITMAYRQVGSCGPKILMIHGNLSSSAFFQNIMAEFEDSMTIYAVDLVGMGDSDFVERDSFYEFAQDVRLFIEAKELDKFIILGWSMGGAIGMELAAMMPERVDHLILTSSVSVKGYTMYGFGGAALPFMTRRLCSREDVEKEPVTVLPVANALKEQNRSLMKVLWNTLIFNSIAPPPKLFERLLDEVMKQRNLIDINTALVTFNMTHENNGAMDGNGRISKIDCPMTIVHGSNDMIISYSYARENRQYFKKLKPDFFEIPHCGHAVFIDHPNTFNDILRTQVLGEDIIKSD
ncbi:MAG: alpha/beta hydrolase [Tissierellia bacterium]|nr:alpha/beta hydrolase [Tissierellia bacterium]